MNDADWYTDRADVYRVQSVKEGSLTKQTRTLTVRGLPCRVYRSGGHGPNMQSTAAYFRGEDRLACANQADIRAGDELKITRGGGLGQTPREIRAFAGEPAPFYEPFGAVVPGLAHQEIPLLELQYVR